MSEAVRRIGRARCIVGVWQFKACQMRQARGWTLTLTSESSAERPRLASARGVTHANILGLGDGLAVLRLTASLEIPGIQSARQTRILARPRPAVPPSRQREVRRLKPYV